MKQRRNTNVFSLSFLDCICCGFGAVILLFVIVNARSAAIRNDLTSDLRAEADRLEREVKAGQKGLVELRNTIEEVDEETSEAEGESRRLIEEIERIKQELSEFEKETLASKEHINKLKSDLKSMEEDAQRLKAGSLEDDDTGQQIRSFKGDGNRQYLTDMLVGGRNILIAVDASASMLAEKIVDIVRLKNSSTEQKRTAKKWQQTVRTVDWITTQLPANSEVQVVVFNDIARPVLKSPSGDYHDSADPEILKQLNEQLGEVVPDKGTSLHQLYLAMREMNPVPDNVFLITDGLPTMAAKKGFGKAASGNERRKYFDRADKLRPKGASFNIILMPMEGDPEAAKKYWIVAQKSKGSFFSPAKDWP